MRRSAMALSAAATGISVPLMLFVWLNPLHFRHADSFVAPLIGLAALSVAALLALAVRHRAATVIAAVLSVLGVFLAGLAWFTYVTFNDDSARDVSRVVGPDGRYELVTVMVAPFTTIDPYTEVRIRTGRGLLSRETVVWEGHEDGPGTRTVRFVGPRTVEVITDHGCRYRSAFNGWTLRLHPEHSDPPGRAC